MEPFTASEGYYRRVLNALGIGLLCFLLFLLLMSLAVAGLAVGLALLPISETVGTVIYELLYGILYLSVFLLPIPIMRALMHGARLPWQPLRAERPTWRYLPLIVCGGISAILVQAQINASLVGFFDFDALFDSALPSTDGVMSPTDLLLSLFVMALVPAFCEELLFRGAILTNLLPFGKGTAILISSLAFALMHQNMAQFLYAFCAGILLGVLYERTGSIWNCMILHFCNNASSFVSTVLLQRLGEETGNAVLATLDCILFLLGLIAIVSFVFLLSKKPNLREGIFGRSLPAGDGYVAQPISARRSLRLLLVSPFGIFLISCAVIGLLSALMLTLLGGLV